jgi:Ca-activated chloride channel family protein
MVMGLCLVSAHARGIVIPIEKSIPPLAMLNHRVNVTIDDQVALTQIEQTFRNHTSRPLEATYIFPVPKGASVREFSMWVDGKKVKGELVEAEKAKRIYTDIVRQTQDPGLLEYIGHDLFQMKIFPVPPNGDQKIELNFSSVARREKELVEFIYPMRTDGKAAQTLEDFTLKLSLKSQHPVVNIYSPSHAITIDRKGDKEATVQFEKNQAVLDRDFVLYYTIGGKDVELTTLQHRPNSKEDGYFMFLISPRFELSKSQIVPRDMVFVLDTSGSMREDNKLEQAKEALQQCLGGMSASDRFGLINFATTVNHYRSGLQEVSSENVDLAKKWVGKLEATGGTCIDDALAAALEMRTQDPGRTFTIVFITDGKPTIGERNTDKILANVSKKNTANTRIFTLGVGHDLNAAFLDQTADRTRALSTFIRPGEQIQTKVATFFERISRPVLANLKLTPGPGISLSEVYPPQLPDLFQHGEIVVMGKYTGTGHAAIRLAGTIGMESREFVYELDFKEKSEKEFVEELWARRKVGYLLEQLRINGESKEVVDEVTKLAKKFGIATPYTSYLVVPDAPLPVVGRPRPVPLPIPGPHPLPPVLRADAPGAAPKTVADLAKEVQQKPGELASNRGKFEGERLDRDAKAGEGKKDGNAQAAAEAREKMKNYDEALRAFKGRQLGQVQNDKLGVDLSIQVNQMKYQAQVQQNALRRAGTRNCLELGGVYIDEGYDANMKTVNVKAQSNAYFRILERHPEVKDVYKLGNHLVWVSPSQVALVIDTSAGVEELTDAEIDKLFAK